MDMDALPMEPNGEAVNKRGHDPKAVNNIWHDPKNARKLTSIQPTEIHLMQQ